MCVRKQDYGQPAVGVIFKKSLVKIKKPVQDVVGDYEIHPARPCFLVPNQSYTTANIKLIETYFHMIEYVPVH